MPKMSFDLRLPDRPTDRSVSVNVVGGRASRPTAAPVAPRAAEQHVALRVLRGDLVVRLHPALLLLLLLLLQDGGGDGGGGGSDGARVGRPNAAEDARRPEVLLRAGTPHQTVVALQRMGSESVGD